MQGTIVAGLAILGGGFSGPGIDDVKANGVWMLPWTTVNPAPTGRFISGYTYNCQSHTGSEQYAIDFGLVGEPVSAITRGVVNAIGWTDAGGNYISIKGDDGFYSYYGHLSSILKSVNDRVREGDKIAISGNSGGLAEYHLHFSLHSGSTFGAAVVPEPLGGIDHYTHFENYIGPSIYGCPGGSLGTGPPGGFQPTAPAVAATSTYNAGDYFLDGYGGVHNVNGAPVLSVVDNNSWPGWNIARDFKLCPSDDTKGYLLDGYGGIHAVGSATQFPQDSSHLTYWGWDIARSLAINSDCQSGYVLDGWGGVHGFSATVPKPSDPSLTAYWSGWDIARALVLVSGMTGAGYTLDGWGSLHPFGNAPAISGTQPPWWPNWDIARSMVLTVDNPCCSGYTLDGWGGVHEFGPNAHPPSYTWFPNLDIARAITLRRYYFVHNQRPFPPYGYWACGFVVEMYSSVNSWSENC